MKEKKWSKVKIKRKKDQKSDADNKQVKESLPERKRQSRKNVYWWKKTNL